LRVKDSLKRQLKLIAMKLGCLKPIFIITYRSKKDLLEAYSERILATLVGLKLVNFNVEEGPKHNLTLYISEKN